MLMKSCYQTNQAIRDFLANYARPSTLQDLLEAIGDEPENAHWRDLVAQVYHDLTGEAVPQ